MNNENNEIVVNVKYTFRKEPPPEPQPQATSDVEIEICIEKKPGNSIKIIPAFACLPCGVHRVYWIFRQEPDEEPVDVLEVITSESRRPAWVKEVEAPNQILGGSGKFTAVYDNLHPTEEVGAIHYDLHLDTQKGKIKASELYIDPTIAVTNDPPPGHCPPYRP